MCKKKNSYTSFKSSVNLKTYILKLQDKYNYIFTDQTAFLTQFYRSIIRAFAPLNTCYISPDLNTICACNEYSVFQRNAGTTDKIKANLSYLESEYSHQYPICKFIKYMSYFPS